jgi:hypothetical protein
MFHITTGLELNLLPKQICCCFPLYFDIYCVGKIVSAEFIYLNETGILAFLFLLETDTN